MKTNVDPYWINLTDLEESVDFYEAVPGVEVTPGHGRGSAP